jgi:hypothetical protein
MSTNQWRFGFACIGLAMSLTSVVHAQSLQSDLRACRAETDDARRLRCYDRAATALDKNATSQVPAAPSSTATPSSGTAATTPLSTPQLPVAAPSTAPATSSAAASAPANSEVAEFGVSEGPIAAKRQATSLKQITAVVAAVSTRPRGEILMTLDNGQVWLQNEAVAYFPLKVGDTVQIHAGAVGSYVLLAPSKRVTKVTRLH